MTTYTTIPDANLEPGKPARSVDALALRDNPLAIAEGDATAPRIDPINAMEHQGAVAAVGTYAFLFCRVDTSTDLAPGDTVSGAVLRYTGISSQSDGWPDNTAGDDTKIRTISTSITGTWRCMSHIYRDSFGTGVGSAGVFLRIA